MMSDTCPKMQKLITEITAKYGVDLETDQVALKLELPGLMPLVIETPWRGEVAVGHTFVQNGDLMYDPEVVFMITPFGWKVLEYTQHPLGIYQRFGEKTGENVRYRLGELRNVKHVIDFVEHLWADNLRSQGYLDHGVRKEQA